MGPRGKLAVKFQERAVLGKFCLALSDDDIPFTLAGFRTVVLAEKDFRLLPERLRQLAIDSASVAPARRGEKRPPLPTPEETRELLRKFVTGS